MSNRSKIYLRKTVVEASTERISWIFDRYANIVVSVSGGKDSTVLFDLAHKEAVRRQREINVFFLDQEAEYDATIEIIRHIMSHELVIPYWFQCPILMTNATSYEEEFLRAWEPGEEWIRKKEEIAIKENPDSVDRFYPFMEWFESQWGEDTAFLIGLRSEESLNRYGAVTRNPAIPGVNWSSKAAKSQAIKFYPIYDWTFEDIWTYIGDKSLKYNRIYDYMYMREMNMRVMRVSNLIHEKAFGCLAQLQEFEPDTYDRLIKRLKGTQTAARYAGEQMIYNVRKRPDRFRTWEEYRDFLLDTYPNERREIFLERFTGQNENERVYQQQVRQLLINDWENNVPVENVEAKEDPLEKWKEIL